VGKLLHRCNSASAALHGADAAVNITLSDIRYYRTLIGADRPRIAAPRWADPAGVHYNPRMGSGPLTITQTLAIPDDELVERFVRASGAGGQNVNKVATAVELRFDIARSPSLPEALRERLLARADRRLTDEGVMVIDAQRFRTQDRNRQDARERLAAFIADALHVPRPRIATRPSRAAKARRLDAKRGRGDIKRTRAKKTDWE
jgi:ribosome-associated protein